MAGLGNSGFFIIYIVFFIGIMYLMVFLPQKRREKKTREMLGALQVGSTVTTVGGITGKIINIKDDDLTIESGVDKTKILVKKWAIKEVEKPIEA